MKPRFTDLTLTVRKPEGPARKRWVGRPAGSLCAASKLGAGRKEENAEGCGGKRLPGPEKAPAFPGLSEFLEQPTKGVVLKTVPNTQSEIPFEGLREGFRRFWSGRTAATAAGWEILDVSRFMNPVSA
jgi:hypothetical protein